MEGHPAGWFPDPSGQQQLRYWDGNQWTNNVLPAAAVAPAVAVSDGAPGVVVSRPLMAARFVYGGCAGVVVGALLPWAEVTAPFVGTVSKKGTEGDGTITLVMGIVAAVAAWRSLSGTGRKGLVAALVLGLLVTVTAIVDMVDVASRFADIEFARVSIGVGLWTTLLGGFAIVAGSVMALMQRPR